MRRFSTIAILTFTTFLSACSYGYEIVIVNESDKPIEIRYRISEKGQFDEAMTKALEDWNERGSIKHFWTEEQPWRNLPDGQVETNLRERIIKVAPKQAVRIEQGHYNPITEEYGDLTDIVDLKIISPNGELTVKGKSLLGQFEKEGYTFVKRYNDDIKNRN